MKDRCDNAKHKYYKDYGGRGITVSDELRDFAVYAEYIESLPNAYHDGYTVDRRDNDRGYERGNLRWTSVTVQNRNVRKIRTDNTSGVRGVSWHKTRKKWLVKISVNGSNINLGRYKSKLTAMIVYDQYITDNELEHTTNGIPKQNDSVTRDLA